MNQSSRRHSEKTSTTGHGGDATSGAGSGAPLVGGVTGTRFDAFELPVAIRDGIRDAGFTHCTPIQEKVLPLSLAGHDIAAQAQTGTGKTAAFLITLFTKLLAAPEPPQPGAPRALIIAPTRELVVQITSDARLLGGHTDLAIHAVYGGVDYRKQREVMQRGVDVVAGTPGRLIDYYKQRVYNLRRAEMLVIDEADRMFDMGFIRDLRFLLRRLPPYSQRQSMLFSATLSYAVVELAYEHMNDPRHVSASSTRLTADKIDHLIYHVGNEEKSSLLVGLVRQDAAERVLVFTNMRRTAQRLVDLLDANSVRAAPITGDMEQRQRLKILERFKTGDLPVLVATDVASRGLHIDGVTHVINYDLPQDPEDYVHRCGRTARAGAAGKAISLVSEDAVDSLQPIEALIGFKLPFLIPDDAAFPRIVRPSRWRHRDRTAPGPGRRPPPGRGGKPLPGRTPPARRSADTTAAGRASKSAKRQPGHGTRHAPRRPR